MTFEPHRRHLFAVAYRMLGSVADAEDVVQDAFVRWQGVDATAIDSPRAYLSTVVTRLCLDRLRSLRAQREAYVGPWLPEPLVEDDAAAIAHDVSVALLMTLERLSPLERAAFLLHDVFDMQFAEVAAILERSEAAVRQLASRARAHVRRDTPADPAPPAEAQRLAEGFRRAVVDGDLAAIADLLATDAVFYSDGGGKRAAATKPVVGRERILRFIVGVTRVRGGIPPAESLHAVRINGMPGIVIQSDDGVETIALDIRESKIVAMYAVRNPDKLRHLA